MLLYLSLLNELMTRVVSPTVYTGIDLSPGVYVGQATNATRDCWPDMAAVSLSLASGESTKSTIVKTKRGGRKTLIALGFAKKYGQYTFRRNLKAGHCFYVNGPHTYPRVAPRLMGVEFAAHIPFCIKYGRLVMYLDARKRRRTIESQNGEEAAANGFRSASSFPARSGASAAAAAGGPYASTISRENMASRQEAGRLGEGTAELVNLLNDRPSTGPPFRATSGSLPGSITAFRKERILNTGKVIVEGTVKELDDYETTLSGSVVITFESTADDSFTRLHLPDLVPVSEEERLQLYGDGISSSTRCFKCRPSVMPYGGFQASTPDLATAEALPRIRPLRLDNLYICNDGDVWTIHLGDDHAVDGFEEKVIVRLTDVDPLEALM